MLHGLSPIPFREHTPAGHRGAWEAIGDGAEKVIVRRHSAAGSRADFIDASVKSRGRGKTSLAAGPVP